MMSNFTTVDNSNGSMNRLTTKMIGTVLVNNQHCLLNFLQLFFHLFVLFFYIHLIMFDQNT